MSAAFARLHPKIQEAIWNQHWDELRPLQVDAIQAVLDTADHLVLAAATASGKTEAVFLPILSQIAAHPEDSVQVLYISPLKALINDQFRRLEDLCAYAHVPVHRWHGDVNASDKQRLRKSPNGILLITPESLESQFINHNSHLKRIYAHLQFVVIDELHAFLDNVRGIHLRSLLARLGIAAGVTPRTFGLSATIGDFAPAKSFLCADAPETVRILEDASQQKDVKIGLKAYVQAPERSESGSGPTPPASGPAGLEAIAEDIAQRFRGESNLIFCNSRRQTELLADQLRQISERERWGRNPFLLHHGSLSRSLREDVERELKSGLPVTAICTSTLEMGIDIGSVRTVGQVEPTSSVASLVQRLGRSGRRDGEAQTLRLYALDKAVTQNSSLEERLFPELLRAIALLELHRDRWLEPPRPDRHHFSTCVHQVLSMCRQTGGTSAARLLDVLCTKGAFRRIDSNQFATLLRGLAARQLIEQVPTGELILAPQGERIVGSYDFYAAFASSIEYRVEHDGQPIGVLAKGNLPAEGEFLLFGGRRWRAEFIDHTGKRLVVKPARGWKPPRFSGGIGGLHQKVVERMRHLLEGDSSFSYLSADAARHLFEARQVYVQSGLASNNTVTGPSGIEWFPWCGTSVLATLELCAKADGIKVERDGLSLRYRGLSGADFAEHRTRISQNAFSPGDLVDLVPDLQRDRFDEYVSDDLLRCAYAEEELDLETARSCAGSQQA